MALPNELYPVLETDLGVSIRHAVRVRGGMVSQAAKVVTTGGHIFVKWKADAAPPIPEQGDVARVPGMFESEADGLRRLAATGTLRLPEVLGFADRASDDDDAIPYLALEWIEPAEPDNVRAFTRNFAGGLAKLHSATSTSGGHYGLDHDNYLGRRRQSNRWTASWPDFYRDQRIVPMIDLARQKGRLDSGRERRLNGLAERVGDLLTHDEPPCLIHGDLWSGNFLSAGDQPVILDPAVYYANREVELAYIQLFGGFPGGFMDAYSHECPLDPGYSDRRPLLQLYPLLVHLISFGEDYGLAVDAVCRRYLA